MSVSVISSITSNSSTIVVPAFLQWFIEFSMSLVAFTVIKTNLINPLIKQIEHVKVNMQEFSGLPDRMKSVIDTVNTMSNRIEKIENEFKPNGGDSLRDQTNYIAKKSVDDRLENLKLLDTMNTRIEYFGLQADKAVQIASETSQELKTMITEFKDHNKIMNTTEIAMLANQAAQLDVTPLQSSIDRAIIPVEVNNGEV